VASGWFASLRFGGRGLIFAARLRTRPKTSESAVAPYRAAACRNTFRTAALACVVALGLAACGKIENMMPDTSSFRLPSTSTFMPTNMTSYSREVSAGPASPGQLANAQGLCSGTTNTPTEGAGVGLEMTECDVVGALGPPQSIEIGTAPTGDRSAVMTYTSGEHAGIYRFTRGRLVSIERGNEPPPPPPATKPTKRKNNSGA
jgi:hypothetical protein